MCILMTDTVVRIPRNFSWFVEGKLAAMGYPESEDVPFLAMEGIKTLINLTGDSPSYMEAAKTHRITVHSTIRIKELLPPTPEQIMKFLQIVENAKSVMQSRFTCTNYIHIVPYTIPNKEALWTSVSHNVEDFVFNAGCWCALFAGNWQDRNHAGLLSGR